jgi:ketopantoate reductase
MRICVYGAGAIGGNFATRLAAAGNEVSLDAIEASCVQLAPSKGLNRS